MLIADCIQTSYFFKFIQWFPVKIMEQDINETSDIRYLKVSDIQSTKFWLFIEAGGISSGSLPCAVNCMFIAGPYISSQICLVSLCKI